MKRVLDRMNFKAMFDVAVVIFTSDVSYKRIS